MKINTVNINVIAETYDVGTEGELTTALSAIGSGKGIIYLTDYITLTSVITLSGGGSYVIKGMGDNTGFDTGGDWKTFYITSAESVVLKDFKIDATDVSTSTNYTIDINESSDNPILIDNISFISTFDNYCIHTVSDNITICNSRCIGTDGGIFFDGASYGYVYNNYFYLKVGGAGGVTCHNGASHIIIADNIFECSTEYDSYTPVSGLCSYILIIGNICYNIGNGFYFTGNVSHIIITGNTIFDYDLAGVYICGDYCTVSGNVIHSGNRNSAGIGYGINLGYISAANYNVITGNLIYNIQNGSSGPAYGIRIDAGSENTIVGNTVLNCKTATISNGGSNTYLADNNTA